MGTPRDALALHLQMSRAVMLALLRLQEGKSTSREEGLLLHAPKAGASERMKQWTLRPSMVIWFRMTPKVCVRCVRMRVPVRTRAAGDVCGT